MKFVSLVVVTSLMALQAQAEVLKCSFTEPFLGINYDPVAKTVQIHEAIENVTNTYPVVETRTNADGSSEVLWGTEEELSSLRFFESREGGSDGMSEIFFPMVGEYRTGDTMALIGGCETKSNPAVDPYKSPVPGCYEVLRTQFEDGASYYMAVGEKIITPLKQIPSAKALAGFLEHALVIRGNMSVDLELCRTLDEVVQ